MVWLFTKLARKDSARIYTNSIHLNELRIYIPFLSQENTLDVYVILIGTFLLSQVQTHAASEWELVRS